MNEIEPFETPAPLKRQEAPGYRSPSSGNP
ncbi:hypothetical protein AM2010_1945 [Pelagerythrobacter marensis]|uniref:Uncharacterized protein n=1 Tax=Pelagerythrobacter marensis TaxID=543877 RepID=A0A0G3X9Y3_9SPHN|nr:hypothetical protein AM2010_1945 [Pelagerythrobacter marensis]